MSAQDRYDLSPEDGHPEIIAVPLKRVSCDGGGGALGHPLVWYDMGEEDYVVCKYCDRLFVLDGSPEHLSKKRKDAVNPASTDI